MTRGLDASLVLQVAQPLHNRLVLLLESLLNRLFTQAVPR